MLAAVHCTICIVALSTLMCSEQCSILWAASPSPNFQQSKNKPCEEMRALLRLALLSLCCVIVSCSRHHENRKAKRSMMTLQDLPPIPHISAVRQQRRCAWVSVKRDVEHQLQSIQSGEARAALCLGDIDSAKNVTCVRRLVLLKDVAKEMGEALEAAKESGLSIVGYMSGVHVTSNDSIPFTAEQFLNGCLVRRHATHKDQFVVLSCYTDAQGSYVILEAFQVSSDVLKSASVGGPPEIEVLWRVIRRSQIKGYN